MNSCPCGSGREYSECCEPLITGKASAKNPEALMRSRYTAFAGCEVDYLGKTLDPRIEHDFDPKTVKNWAENSRWLNLEVISASGAEPDDTEGKVEFKARYEVKGTTHEHHEIAEFAKLDGTWYYRDGEVKPQAPFVRQGPKIGRNDPCPCGSGKKYKKCCGS